MSDQLKGRIVAADVKGERLLVTIQLDKIEPVGVGARVQIVHHGMRADVLALVETFGPLIDLIPRDGPKPDAVRKAQSALAAVLQQLGEQE